LDFDEVLLFQNLTFSLLSVNIKRIVKMGGKVMATFCMFGKYSGSALKGISAERTKEGMKLIEKLGGKVQTMLALLGENDLLFIVDFPDLEKAMQASVALAKMTGIAFKTFPAIAVKKFDELVT
jgi:uncharacterized protein with GYD domain